MSFSNSCFPPVNLSTEVTHKLRIYQEHFEKAYIQSTTQFYSVHAPAYLAENGVQNYMKYVSCILQCSRMLVNEFSLLLPPSLNLSFCLVHVLNPWQ